MVAGNIGVELNLAVTAKVTVTLMLPILIILPRVDNGEESIELPYRASKMIA